MHELIIVGIVCVIILITVSTITLAIRRAIRRVKNSVVGQIIDGISNEINTGKVGPEDLKFNQAPPPRSVSDMSSTLISRITRDFPNCNVEEMKSGAAHILSESLSLIETRTAPNCSLMGDTLENALYSTRGQVAGKLDVTDAYVASLQQIIDAERSQNRQAVYRQIAIRRSGINAYEKNNSSCVITFQFAVEYLHYYQRNGNVISGNRATVTQSRYNVKVINIMDETRLANESNNAFGIACPNCGAAVTNFGDTYCQFCGSAVKAVDMRIWKIDSMCES
ncbi:MAG TPA: hypothetical protein PK567_05020 [Bacillota bacterium]|nr:hypothetical protein [Bacillota bacterium]